MTAAALRLDPGPQLPDLDAILPGLTAAFAATAGQHDREASFPFANFEALRQANLLALTAPRRLGGLEADLPTALKVISAVARGEPATALVLVMQYLFHASVEGRSGWPEHLKSRVIGEAIDKGALINALRVEPDLGTPARGGLPGTVARRTPEGWRISGRKIYSTGSTALTWFVVWARSDDRPDQGGPLVGGWLVRADTPGITIEETWDHLGLRASASHDVVFEDVLVPLDHALDPQPVGAPPPYPASFAAWSAVLTSAIYDAVARAARDWLVDFLSNRKPANLGAALSTLPRFQEAVGDIDGLLLSNRVLLDTAARGEVGGVEAGLVKHLVTENAISVVEKALKLTGNPGLTRHNPLERHHRDVLCGRVHTPQSDVVLSSAGKTAFAAHASEIGEAGQ
ncbi:acyl-CoA dehydrogenase [Caulobacter sp. AP07]|uniref:acyl-CoA dehydrogenase family protein n=1 Tax=Caulobacter sp. AP07 TaxID=1144304 RepID=UPI000271F7CC|nr:acyl-CoA dehydrogenase family protein [Caulobacter sp. AP07]EJL27816.1 acyl-CoA dehydrogenase [Caulobacter sp. AP07]